MKETPHHKTREFQFGMEEFTYRVKLKEGRDHSKKKSQVSGTSLGRDRLVRQTSRISVPQLALHSLDWG